MTEAHRLAQSRLGALTVRQMLAAWALLEADDLDGTVERWLRVAIPIVRLQRSDSAALAGSYTRLFRRLELGAGVDDTPPVLADEIAADQVAASLTSTGPITVKANIGRGREVDRAMEIGQAAAAAAAMRLALNGGRETVLNTARSDTRSVGWMRVTSGKPCAWCAMIASRGVVFWTRESAEAATRPAHAKGHDGCNCMIEPAYRGSTLPPSSQRWSDLWSESTAGLGGNDARKAFRTALETSLA